MKRRTSPRRLTAAQLILGHSEAEAVLYHGRRVALIPARRSDHHRRYHEGLRLAVKGFVGGSVVCRVVVMEAGRVRLGDVDDRLARELGYGDRQHFRICWVEEHDPEESCYIADLAARFDAKHAHREAWLIRFRLDTQQPARLLAQRSEEGYTDSPARALRGELPALDEDQWRQHVHKPSQARERDRIAQQRQDREAMALDLRARQARTAAQTKGYQMRDEFRRLDRLLGLGRLGEAERQVQIIEARVFPEAA